MTDQFHPGQHVTASDGARYVLAFFAEGCWWGVRAGSYAGRLPRPLVVRYAAWGSDDAASERELATPPHGARA